MTRCTRVWDREGERKGGAAGSERETCPFGEGKGSPSRIGGDEVARGLPEDEKTEKKSIENRRKMRRVPRRQDKAGDGPTQFSRSRKAKPREQATAGFESGAHMQATLRAYTHPGLWRDQLWTRIEAQAPTHKRIPFPLSMTEIRASTRTFCTAPASCLCCLAKGKFDTCFENHQKTE